MDAVATTLDPSGMCGTAALVAHQMLRTLTDHMKSNSSVDSFNIDLTR